MHQQGRDVCKGLSWLARVPGHMLLCMPAQSIQSHHMDAAATCYAITSQFRSGGLTAKTHVECAVVFGVLVEYSF